MINTLNYYKFQFTQQKKKKEMPAIGDEGQIEKP